MTKNLEKIIIEKEGNGYSLYVNDLHCGWGNLEDLIETLEDNKDDLIEFMEDCQECR